MKKRGLYVGISFIILVLLLLSILFVAFGGWEIFLNKNGSLSASAVVLLCTCVLLSVCDIALFLLTKQGKITLKQSFSQLENILVYLAAIVLITTLVSYCTIFCVDTLEKATYSTQHESIVDMISST